MVNLNELARGGTMCLSKAGLAIGSTAKELSFDSPNGDTGIEYAIKGILYYLADDATVAVTAGTAQSALTTCIYLVCLDSSGTLSTVQGTEQLNASLTAGTVVLDWPTPTADTCCIGAAKVKCENAATFTAGTTDFDETDVTTTYYDLLFVPVDPLTS